MLSALGGLGPGVAAMAVIGWFSGGLALRSWLARCLQWRIGSGPFVWVFFLPLTVLAPAAYERERVEPDLDAGVNKISSDLHVPERAGALAPAPPCLSTSSPRI
ncbi:MAG: hypothetical protein H7Z19_20670 [Chitinophagaceae bacterium]|nr:hypothetical protein [Rubrivivax sp.]